MLTMATYERLTRQDQSLARSMADAAREVLRDAGVRPTGDDDAARFDEACAVFLVRSRARDDESRGYRRTLL